MFILLVATVACANAQTFVIPNEVGSGADCFSKYPHLRERFDWETLEFFCQQKRRIDGIIHNATVNPFTPAQWEFLNTLAVNYTSGVMPAFAVVRKEIRRMSADELKNFETAMRALKLQLVDGISKYDLLVMLHHPALAPGSHVGAAFLPWHREYLRRVETALQQIKPNIAIPYWDSTLDEPLTDPLDSILWTPEFFGNGEGQISEGPYAYWGFRPDNKSELIRLERHAGKNGSLITSDLRDFILSRASYQDLTSCTDLTVEKTSRALHEWVGGAMGNIYYSAQDPLFFFHHVYLDYLWGLYRLKQSSLNRKVDYPSNLASCSEFHYADSEMKPFGPLKNKDGLDPQYADFYHYEYSPSCTTDSPQCGSDYLFCHREYVQCASKVKSGGRCAGLPIDACYLGECRNGICVPVSEPDALENGVPDTDTNRITQSDDPVPESRSSRVNRQTTLRDEAMNIMNLVTSGAEDADGEANSTVNATQLHVDETGENSVIGTLGNEVRSANTDPFKGPIVATDENRQTADEDRQPGVPVQTEPPRPKQLQRVNQENSVDNELQT